MGNHPRFSSFWRYHNNIPASIYLCKVSNGNTKTMNEICSKLTVKTLERHQWRRSSVANVTLNTFSGVSIANFGQINAGWDNFQYFHLNSLKASCEGMLKWSVSYWLHISNAVIKMYFIECLFWKRQIHWKAPMIEAHFCQVKSLYLQYYLKRTLSQEFLCELCKIHVFSQRDYRNRTSVN